MPSLGLRTPPSCAPPGVGAAAPASLCGGLPGQEAERGVLWALEVPLLSEKFLSSMFYETWTEIGNSSIAAAQKERRGWPCTPLPQRKRGLVP